MNPSIREYLSLLPTLATEPVYLVGGFVRNLLMGNEEIKDIDLAMPAGSETIAPAFAHRINGSFFMLDEERKISRVVKQTGHEIIQFDFTNFEGADLVADLERRDFTINAMALELRTFLARNTADSLIDPCNGKEDVRNRLIRVKKPAVLDEDPLRMLRAVRFAAALGFSLETETAGHIRQRAKRIVEPSAERVRDELFLILSEDGAEKHLLLLDSLGLLTTLFPELEPLRGFAPGMYHVHDVLTHSIKTAGNIDRVLGKLPALSPAYAARVSAHLKENLEPFIPRIAALRFACLLHDMAKPDTFTTKDGRIRFHGHDNLGAEKALFVCRRFRLSRHAESLIAGVIKYHMRLFNLASPGGPSRNALYRYCRDLGNALPESLLLSQSDALATSEIMPKDKFTNTESQMAAVLDYYYVKYLKTEATPLVTGNDLIQQGMQPGPRFREILEELKARQAEGMLNSRQEALDYLARLK